MSDSIEQVISASIADLPGNDGSELDTGSGGDVDDGATAAATESDEDGAQVAPNEDEHVIPTPQAAAAEEDELARELGLKPGQKDNRIPYSRVQKIVQKAQEKHAAELKARDERLTKLGDYESEDFQHTLNAWKLADENPEQFLSALAQSDPRYAGLLRQAQAAEAQHSQRQAEPDTQEIEPDVILADGSLGYSPNAVKRMAAQQAQQVAAQIEARLAKQFGPVAKAYEKHQQSTAMRAQAEQKISQQMAQAQSWPGFSDEKNQQAMYDAIKADPSIKTLEQAYFKVVVPKLAQSKEDMRKQLLAEISQKPKGAAGTVRPSAGAAASKAGPLDTEEIIRQSIAGLK